MGSSSLRRLVVVCLFASSVAVFAACSDDAPASTGGGTSDGGPSSKADSRRPSRAPGEDAATEPDSGTSDTDSGEKEAGSCGPIVTTPGETCIGFGAKPETCDPSCEQPYGYVCFDGAPPGFEGCRKASESALGQTYCCPKNDCVAQPDQDATSCSDTAGKPHRFQCPPNGSGGNVPPPAGCEEKGSGGSEVEKFYCCP